MKKYSRNNHIRDNILTSELLILPNGRILVHNLTQPFAELLCELNRKDGQIAARITRHPSPVTLP